MVDTNPYPNAPGESGSIDNIAKLLGVGAYTLDDSTEGSGLNYGQDVGTETFVKSLIYSIAMGMGPGDGSISSALTNLGTYLGTMPLDSLKLLQPFIPGATDNDFADSVSAVEKIMDQFNVEAMLSITDFNNWVQSILDPNSELWQDAKDKWDALMTHLSSYPAAGSSAATVSVWWSTLFVDLGFDPTGSATLGNIIGGNYDWAKQSAANWTAFMASWGVGTPADVAAATAASQAKWNAFLASIGLGSATAAGAQLAANNTNISTQAGYWQRLTEDLWIIYADGLHIYYPLGSPSDTATTTSTAYGTPARRTWYSAQADLKLLQTSAGAPTPPTAVSGDVGTVAQGSVDAINMGLTGTTATGATPATAQAAAAGLAATLAEVQSNVQQLAAGSAPVGGIQVTDDGPGVTGTGTGWGSDWTLTGGGAANLNKGFNTTSGTNIGRYNTPLNTDSQIAGIILNSLPAYPWTLASAGARNRVKVRESSDQSSCVFADIWHDKVQLGYRVSNVDTYWGSPVSITPGVGSNWELYAGDGTTTNQYVYKLVLNSAIHTPVITKNDTAHNGLLGSSNRYTGQDQVSDGSYLPGNTKFHARDVILPVTKTMRALHRNTSTTISVLAGGGVYRMPVGWFNNQVNLSPGITMASLKAGYVVAEEGEYVFTFNIGLSTGITGTPYIIAPVIWVNSGPTDEGTSLIYANGGQGSLSVGISKPVYLFAGDEIGPALDTRAQQWNVLGDVNGVASWMQLVKVG